MTFLRLDVLTELKNSLMVAKLIRMLAKRIERSRVHLSDNGSESCIMDERRRSKCR